jgi:putative flippase GtrA
MIKKHVSRVYQNKHFREMCVYGFVGIVALIVQDLIYLIAPKFGVFPTVAMIIGNFAGMFIAYFGHTKLTFKKTHHFSKREFTRFLVTSCVGLLINVGGVRIITKVLGMDHLWGLLPTFISPIVTFLISKFWAFR